MGFNAIHVPEQFEGQGADSIAACIVIEEVARVCGSSSLIPAVNKLGTMGLDALRLPAFIGPGANQPRVAPGCEGRGGFNSYDGRSFQVEASR